MVGADLWYNLSLLSLTATTSFLWLLETENVTDLVLLCIQIFRNGILLVHVSSALALWLRLKPTDLKGELVLSLDEKVLKVLHLELM